METKVVNNIKERQAMTPQEFVRTWNKLLSCTKKNVGDEDQLPKVIFAMDMTEGLKQRLDFVIARVNSDKEFQCEVSKSGSAPVTLQTIIYNNTIQIVASSYEHEGRGP